MLSETICCAKTYGLVGSIEAAGTMHKSFGLQEAQSSDDKAF